MADCSGVLHAATGGDNTWNYFNLFYTSGFPHDGVGTSSVYGIHESGNYIAKISQYQPSGEYVDDGICPSAIPLNATDYDESVFSPSLFSSPSGLFGILETNSKHSCLQDISECGGELWCNKLFFPRRSYKASSSYVSPGYVTDPPYSTSTINGDGTLVAPFGSTSVCQASLERVRDRRYVGWDGSIDPYENPDYIEREIKNRFFDVCDEKILTEVYPYAVGIDDSKISVRDYLPLIGVVHPGWRSTVASKSCVILSTGCGQNFALPTHTDQSIRVGLFAPKTWSANKFDAMGYYLDKAGDGRFASSGVGYTGVYTLQAPSGDPTLPLEKVGASGGDDCLFNPFKILVDVECSTNRVKRFNTPTDEPTNLNFISSMPGAACGGLRKNPPCSCSETNCNGNYPPFRSTGELVYDLRAQYQIISVTHSGASCTVPVAAGTSGLLEVNGLVPSTVVLKRGVTIIPPVSGFANTGSCNHLTGPLDPTGAYFWLNDSDCNPITDYVYDAGGIESTLVWDCENYLYTYDPKDVDICDSTQGLCDVTYRAPLPLGCDNLYYTNGLNPGVGLMEPRNFSGIYNEHPTTGWFATDCGCSFISTSATQDDQCTESMVKMTITE